MDPKLPSDELNSLRIERSQPLVSMRGRRKRRWVVWLALGLLLALGLFVKMSWYPSPIAVEFGTVTEVSPQNNLLLQDVR